MKNNNIINEKNNGITHNYSIGILKKGLWFIRNKNNFKTSLIAFLILFNVALWSYNIFKTGHYIFIGMKNEDLMIMELVNSNALNYKYMELIAPHGFKYGEIQTFKNKGDEGDEYSVIIEIANINPKHLGTFNYCLMSNEDEIKCNDDFILPGEKKYLFTNIKKDKYVSNMQFVVNSINWKKFDRKKIYDLSEFKEERLRFDFTEINFINGDDNKAISEKIKLSSLIFTAKNNTSFNYYSLPLQIFLYKNGRIVDVNKITIDNFISQDSKSMNIIWQSPIKNISNIKIIPDINIFEDESSIMF